MAMIDLARSETRRRLLGFLFARPDQEFYQRDLERQLQMSIGAIQHEVRRLEEEGLLKRRRLGNLVLFSLNRAHPLYEELTSIVAKTIGIAPALAAAMSNLQGVRLAFVYGSHVSLFEKAGRQRTWSGESDVDLLVVGDVDARAVASTLREIGKRHRREMNYTLLSPAEFRRKLQERDSFLLEVLGKPILPLAGIPKGDYKRPVRLRPEELTRLLDRTS